MLVNVKKFARNKKITSLHNLAKWNKSKQIEHTCYLKNSCNTSHRKVAHFLIKCTKLQF